MPPPTPTVGPVTGPLATNGLGSQTVTCTNDGETATATFTIVTTQSPTLPAMDDATVEIEPDADATTSPFVLPTATDPHGLPVTVTCTPPPGATYPVGTTAVSCVATNVAGLSSAPASFSVTVSRRPRTDTVLTHRAGADGPAGPPHHRRRGPDGPLGREAPHVKEWRLPRYLRRQQLG